MVMADIPYGSDTTHKFVTNVGLITSNGPQGHNIMSAEWTHMMSYKPGMIAILLGKGKTTEDNIKETKEFGVNIAAADQNIITSVAGNSHGRDVDKISALKELGFEFYNAEKIDVLMVKGAALNAECKVIKVVETGDHTMYLGEVVAVKSNEKEPLAYYKGKYWKLTDKIEKPSEEKLNEINKIVEKHRKNN
jgi:flavin reductase (DIM6/NTAB) family NADH-FMN oxidoreductase RutF